MSFDSQQIEQQAAQYLSQGRVEDALKSYKTLLRKDPKSRRLRKTVADLSLKLGNKREAEQLMLAIAESDVKEKQYRMAIPIYRELIKMRPKDHEMHLEIAHCLIESNFDTDALIHLKKAVEMTQRQKPEVAQEIQFRIVTMSPGELNERRTFAELLEAANWSDKASDAWKDFAVLNRKLGKTKEAARAIERALTNRENWETRLEAAQCRFESSEPRKALEHLQKVYKDFPTDPKVLALLATGLQMVGHESQAKQLWLEAGKRYEDAIKKSAAFEEAVVCGATEAELPEDIEDIKRLAAAEQLALHTRPWALVTSKVEQRFALKTRLYLEFGRFADALASIESAEGLEKRPSIFALRVEALVVNDRIEEAIEILQAFKNSDPEIMADVQLRLLGLGLSEEDSEELIDDDLLDDDLEDLDEDFSEESESEHSPEPSFAPVSGTETMMQQAELLFASGDSQAALDLLNQILEIEPTNMSALEKMGVWALQTTATQPAAPESDSFTSDPFAMAPDPFGTGTFGTAFENTLSEDPFAVATNDESVLSASEALPQAGRGSDILWMREELQQAYKYILVGFQTEAEAELKRVGTLSAVIGLTQLRIAKENYRGALDDIQDALDKASTNDPLYLDALWEVARLYSLQQRVRNTTRTLDEIVELNSGYRAAEINLWRSALASLD
jgi:tetratricopeptide (TPR) repeat protein